jgi:hypothetical protein
MMLLGLSSEPFHSIKTKTLQAMVIKLDLSKAYGRVIWLYILLILIHIGCNVPFVNWIMGCSNYVSFSILLMDMRQVFLSFP